MSVPSKYRRADAALLVLLALVGTWIGHNAVYLVASGGGIVSQLTSPMHAYMIPAGAALFGIAVLGGVAWASAMNRLRERLATLQRVLRRPGQIAPPGTRAVTRTVDIVSVWLTLTAIQLVLYIAQENLEARAAHVPLRGFAVVLGAHWAAVPVHALLALALAALAVGGRRRTVRLERAVRALGRLVDRIARRRADAGFAPSPGDSALSLTPHQRWGSCRWQRPPPFVVA